MSATPAITIRPPLPFGESVCVHCGRVLAAAVETCPVDGHETVGCPTRLEPGLVLAGRYLLMEQIAFGGWGIVFRAIDEEAFDTEVAVKFLSPQHLYELESIRRFLREQRIISRLHHPHLVTQLDHGRSAHGLFIVMELLRGRALADEIRGGASLAPARAARIAAQVCSGLQVAHDHRVVHRDLKPANIFLCSCIFGKDFAKVMDFGISKAPLEWESDPGTPHTPLVYGTPYYVSPEQACAREVDGRSDLYSLGVIVFQMLTGSLPFPPEPGMLTMQRRVDEPAPYIPRAFPRLPLPTGLCDLVAQLLERNPQDRPACAHEAQTRFLEFAGSPEE